MQVWFSIVQAHLPHLSCLALENKDFEYKFNQEATPLNM